jgi:exportin-2 (importin alpha re-exporter)
MELFPHLLAPALWESKANSTPLVRLLQAFLSKGNDGVFTDDSQLEGMLGVYQKLISSKVWMLATGPNVT